MSYLLGKFLIVIFQKMRFQLWIIMYCKHFMKWLLYFCQFALLMSDEITAYEEPSFQNMKMHKKSFSVWNFLKIEVSFPLKFYWYWYLLKIPLFYYQFIEFFTFWGNGNIFHLIFHIFSFSKPSKPPYFHQGFMIYKFRIIIYYEYSHSLWWINRKNISQS